MRASIQTSIKTKRLLSLGSSKSAIYIILLCIIILLLATKGIRDEGTVSLQGDMPRYLMNDSIEVSFDELLD
jgi:hypothetical protein